VSRYYYERLLCAPGGEPARADDAYSLALRLSAGRMMGRLEYDYRQSPFYEPTPVAAIPGAGTYIPSFFGGPYRGVLPLAAQPVISRPFPFEERHAGVS
jgi:hypothetical protein